MSSRINSAKTFARNVNLMPTCHEQNAVGADDVREKQSAQRKRCNTLVLADTQIKHHPENKKPTVSGFFDTRQLGLDFGCAGKI